MVYANAHLHLNSTRRALTINYNVYLNIPSKMNRDFFREENTHCNVANSVFFFMQMQIKWTKDLNEILNWAINLCISWNFKWQKDAILP